MEKKGRTTKGFVLTCIWGGQKVVPPKVLIEIVFGYPKTCFGRSYIYIYIMRLFRCGAHVVNEPYPSLLDFFAKDPGFTVASGRISFWVPFSEHPNAQFLWRAPVYCEIFG